MLATHLIFISIHAQFPKPTNQILGHTLKIFFHQKKKKFTYAITPPPMQILPTHTQLNSSLSTETHVVILPIYDLADPLGSLQPGVLEWG